MNESQSAAWQRSQALEEKISANPSKFRVLTGDRPTGALHIGHYFGTLQNRVRLQNLGLETFILVADYQVITDRDTQANLGETVCELLADYLACGIDPERSTIFAHSQVPELNQLLIPFLSLVSQAELERNPTVKEEMSYSGAVNALMLTYPVHQAADILFCKAHVVPVGLDQLPHLEVTRIIAKRFNQRYGQVLRQPEALLSESPLVPGLDGGKMSKSRNNSIQLGETDEETAKKIRRAVTDAEREITFEPERRPGVANLLRLGALATGRSEETLAAEAGSGGAKVLKEMVTESMNTFLRPIREKRQQLIQDRSALKAVLRAGNERAREVAVQTLHEVQAAMHMAY